ncbi:MAG TPA: 50S ribosomal protein L1 [Gemmatimonadota bacterium]|nr:50S ribosomal protein L1 [Gemmatimonadota bacterium]
MSTKTAHRGKRYAAALEKREADKRYDIEAAVDVLLEMPAVGFDETVEVAVRLGVDPRHADQIVRGTVVLPNGTGKKVHVTVIAQGEKLREAQEAGADVVGGKDVVEKIQEGWLDTDVIVSTPDMMGDVGKLGRILGPRGLMPNPKSGTVTFDVTRAVKDVKAGKIEFRTDKTGNVQAPVGRRSFTREQLAENIRAFMDTIVRAKPSSAKGQYVRNIAISSTMSPSVPIDVNLFRVA